MKLLLRWKINRLCRGAQRIVRARGVHCWVWWFGAYYIDPRHLVIIIAVPTDAERNVLKKDPAIVQSLQALLTQISWPEQARPHVIVDIESEETVCRESDGNWWYHYK
jgi:hypothetical protein